MAAGLTLTNDQRAPRAAREALSEAMAGLPETTRSDAALLVSELVSNSVVHSSGSDQVDVFVVVDAGSCAWTSPMIPRRSLEGNRQAARRLRPRRQPGRHPGAALGCGATR